MTKIRRRRRNMEPLLQRYIERMARGGRHSPADIFRKMQESEQFAHIDKLPSLRTVENVVKAVVMRDKTGPWSVADSAPEDARIILDVLADAIAVWGEYVFNKAEAAWVLKIAKLAPGLRHIDLLELAQLYLLAEGKGESTEGLDAYLAFMPWKSKNRFENYKYALEQGWIKEVPEIEWRWCEFVPLAVPDYLVPHVEDDPSALSHIRETWERGITIEQWQSEYREANERLAETESRILETESGLRETESQLRGQQSSLDEIERGLEQSDDGGDWRERVKAARVHIQSMLDKNKSLLDEFRLMKEEIEEGK